MLRSISVAGALAISAFTAQPLQTTVVARPAQPLQAGQGRPHGLPPEAVDACKNQSEGAACSVEMHGQTMDGTCRNGPDGNGPLACAPNHPPAPPPEAVEACINKAAGDTCSVQFDERTIDGTCRSLPQESDLVCLPSSPPR